MHEIQEVLLVMPTALTRKYWSVCRASHHLKYNIHTGKVKRFDSGNFGSSDRKRCTTFRPKDQKRWSRPPFCGPSAWQRLLLCAQHIHFWHPLHFRSSALPRLLHRVQHIHFWHLLHFRQLPILPSVVTHLARADSTSTAEHRPTRTRLGGTCSVTGYDARHLASPRRGLARR